MTVRHHHSRRYPSLPLSPLEHGAARVARAADSIETAVIPVRQPAEQLDLPNGSTVPDSIVVQPTPRYGNYFTPADDVLLDLVRENAWRDPVCFAATAGPDGLGWLEPYGRLEGLHRCIVPVRDIGVNLDLLRANLLEHHAYRGYADRSVEVDQVSGYIGALYLSALGVLLEAEAARGDTDRCREDAKRLLAAVPPDRLKTPEVDREEIEATCRT